jgi:hypothetical protein
VFFSPGAEDHNVNAQIEVDRLAAAARGDREQDPADESAERMTNEAQSVIWFAVFAVFCVAGAGLFFGTVPAVLTAGVAGLFAIAFVVVRRVRKARGDV